MFNYEFDSTQRAHLNKSQMDKLNSYYEQHRDPKAYERFKHMPCYSTNVAHENVNDVG